MFVVCKYYEQITQMLFPNIKILCAPPKDYIYKHRCVTYVYAVKREIKYNVYMCVQTKTQEKETKII